MFKKLINKVRSLTSKQLVIAGVFTLALAGSITAGLVTRQFANANQDIRDCGGSSLNSIDNYSGAGSGGGCGALSAPELISDIKNNKPSDLKAIYGDSRIGLSSDKYDRFAKTAMHGILKRNGDVVVDGQVVMHDAWTMGRTTLGNKQRVPIVINGVTYYHSTPEVSFASGRDYLDVMVMFDSNGTVEVVIMNSCGNPITQGHPVKSSATCDALKSHEVNGKKNTYTFTTDVSKKGLAEIEKVEYYIDGKLWKTVSNPSENSPEYTFKKSADVSVKVYVKLPGNNHKVIESVNCKTHITVEQPIFACEALVATARDETNRRFRFTVSTKQKLVTVKDVDFTLDGKATTTGVTTKNDKGDIYKDYDFVDNVQHTISAKVHFTDGDQIFTAPEDCEAKVTPEKPPVCEYNPELPPESPDCKKPTPECKPGIPVGDARCGKLSDTGPGGIFGLFAGASIFGSAAHKLYLRRRIK